MSKLTETASEGITDDVLINIRNLGPTNFTKKPLAQPKMLNLVNRIWAHLKFSQGGVLVCSGNLTLLRNFFWRNKNYKKLKIWVIKACQGSDLGYQGLLLLKFGTYWGYLGHTRVIWSQHCSDLAHLRSSELIGSERSLWLIWDKQLAKQQDSDASLRAIRAR